MNFDALEKLARELGMDPRRQDGKDGPLFCLCGCGETTNRGRRGYSTFKPGHDARLVSALVKRVRDGQASIDDAAKALTHCAGSVLADKLRASWTRLASKATCPVGVVAPARGNVCGKPAKPGHPDGWCEGHAAR